MKIVLILAGSVLFLVSAAAHIYVRTRLRPKHGSDFDEIYWEFEDSHPAFARYSRLSTITFTAAIVGAILLFLSVVF